MANILIVEDNKDVNQLYQRLFFNQKTHGALNGREAIDALEETHYDLILLDMHLPIISGIEVLRHIRNNSTNKDSIVFVVSSDDTLRIDARDIGIQQWFTKPVEIEELLRAVNQALATLKAESS